MRTIKIISAACALLCLTAWLSLRKPYSPTETLPPVAYSAFEVDPPTTEAGRALAKAAHGWQGVTATVYDSVSRLLVISHELALPVSELESRLSILNSHTIFQKKFPEPAGPQCPVPMGLLAVLPNLFAAGGVFSGVLFLGLAFWNRKTTNGKISNLSHHLN